jgi:GntR family transcriptional regulator, carbon starvation induced regulator
MANSSESTALTSKIDDKSGPEFRTMAATLAARIAGDIVSGALEAGCKLKLNMLSKRYGVSPIPLREALSRLASSGLVEIEDQRGYRTAPVSSEDLRDVTWLRQQIECLALRRSIERGNIDWETRIVAAQHRLMRITDSNPGEPPTLNETWERLHREFHAALISGCDSPRLLQIQSTLAHHTLRYRKLMVSYGTERRAVNEEHRRLAEAALARDADNACELLSEHFARTADIVLAAIEQGRVGGAV